MAKRKRMSPEEFDALLREAEAFQEKLRRIVETKQGSRRKGTRGTTAPPAPPLRPATPLRVGRARAGASAT